jgi:hypothetical protein
MKALINYKIGIVFDSKDFAPEFHYETSEQNYEDFYSIECQIILLSPFECGIVTTIAYRDLLMGYLFNSKFQNPLINSPFFGSKRPVKKRRTSGS